MKIAILGTRGIPNNYGGFEQLAEYLSVGLAQKGHTLSVYCSSAHPYRENTFQDVELIHCYDPEPWMGTAGQFIYDLNCILDSRKRHFDVILQLGYTSSSVWARLLPAQSRIITNMDGLEWKRSKYKKAVQQFLKKAEAWAVRSSDELIADSPGIQAYIHEKYQKASDYIAYGARNFTNPDKAVPAAYGLQAGAYHLLIARFEPENNIEPVIQGYIDSQVNEPLLMIGNCRNAYGSLLQKKYAGKPGLIFHPALYDLEVLNNLRHFSLLYFHGHSAGGTNPSLLEAMASGACICAHDNIFNRAVLQENAWYFKQAADISRMLKQLPTDSVRSVWREKNMMRIRDEYSWERIVQQYEDICIQTHETNAS